MTELLQKGQIYEFEVLSKMEISSGKKFYSLKDNIKKYKV